MSYKMECPACGESDLKKRGKERGKQVWKCKECGKRTVNPVRLTLGNSNICNPPTDEKFEFTQDGNNAELDIKVKQIKTLDELISHCDIDLSVWKIEKHVINKWDSTFQGSPIPLFQVKVFLSKIIPDKISIPVIQPLEINISGLKYRNKDNHKAFKKALIIPDIQAGYKRNMITGKLTPFHDRRCLSIALQVARKTQPEQIILVGDNLDMPEISRFTKTPEFYFTLQPALVELAWFLGQLRLACPNADIKYLEGNHEKRLTKTISENAVFAYGLKRVDDLEGHAALSVPNLLALDKIGVEYLGDYPDGQVWINDNLRVTHGTTVKQGSGETVKEVLKNARCSEIFGHIHRLEVASKTVHSKHKIVTYTAFSPGCFCHLDGRVPAFKSQNNWQQGFGVVDYETGNGRFQINQYSINDGVTLFNAEIIEADEEGYLNQLRKDTKWDF